MKEKLLNKKTIITAIILLAAGGIYYNSQREKPIEVERVSLETVTVKKTISGSGTIKSIKEANLSFPGGGRLAQINVEKGDFVNKGTYMAQVYNYDNYQTLQSLKDTRDVAKKDIEIYKENYSTNVHAVGGEDEYYLNLERLEELKNKAEASYQAAQAGLVNTYINAPFDGTVLDVNGEIGETASPAATIIKFADLNNLVFEIELEQEDFGLVKLNQTAEITLDSFPNKTFSGTVVDVPLFVDVSSGENFIVKIKLFPTNDEKILLGMEGDVEILVESTSSDVSALTFDNVYSEDDAYYVWLIENDTLEKMPVEIGLEGDLYTEIKTEINKDIVIPIDSDIDLEPGKKVTIIE